MCFEIVMMQKKKSNKLEVLVYKTKECLLFIYKAIKRLSISLNY